MPTVLERKGVDMLMLAIRGLEADRKDTAFLFYLRRSGILSGIDIKHI